MKNLEKKYPKFSTFSLNLEKFSLTCYDSLMFSPIICTVSFFTLSSFTHFEFILVYDMQINF